jgi:uncharacterized delta-60 repeat protein
VGYVVHAGAAGGNAGDQADSIVLDSKERILATGRSANSSNADMAIWRYNADGTLDTGFNGTGFAVHDGAAGGNGDDQGYSLVLDSKGRILVAGSSTNTMANRDMAIWRYTPNGTLDTTFDVTGYVAHGNAAGGNGNDEGTSIALDASGRILVAGASVNATGNVDMAIWRYNEDGTPDNTFDGKGYTVHDGAAGGYDYDVGASVVLDGGGRILVAGASANAANPDMCIWRYNEDGTLDTTFGGTGYVVHNGAAGGNSTDFGYSMALDGWGRILVTGVSANSALNGDMVIWRYNPDGTLDRTFDGTGFVVHHGAAGGNSDDIGFAIALDAGGRIVVTGWSTNAAGDWDMVVWRYNPNGTLDTTFNGTGYVVHNDAAGGNENDSGHSVVLDSLGRILVGGKSRGFGNDDMAIWRYR